MTWVARADEPETAHTNPSQRPVQPLVALHEIGREMAAGASLPELLQLLVGRVVELTQAAGGGLCRYRPELDRLEWVATSGQGEALNGRLVERDQGVAGRVWAAGHSLLLDEERETQPDETWSSAVAVPIHWSENFLGALLVFSFTAGAFTPADVHLLELFAMQAAAALEHERLAQAEEATREMAQAQTDELRARHRYLTLLNEITLTALERPDLEAMLRFMSERLVEVVDANYCYITLWDDEQAQVIPTAAAGDTENRYAAVQIEPQELTATASLYRYRRPLLIPDPYNSPYISPSVVARFPIKSLLALPMLAGEQFLGAVLLAYDEPHHFTQSEIEQGVQAARQVALAVVRAQLLQTEREQRLQAETLAEVTLALTAQTELTTVLDEILYQAQRVAPYSTANISLFDGRQLSVVRSRGYEQFNCRPFMEGLVQMLDDIPLERPAIEEGIPYILSDVSQEPQWYSYPETAWVRSFMSLPMRLRERTIGLLRMDSDRPGQFTEEVARRLQPLANAAAIAIENANLLEETRRRNAELTMLNRISEVMLTSHSLRSAFQQIAAAIAQLTDFPIVTLEEYDRTRQLMVYWGAVGLQQPAGKETLEVSVDESLSGQVVRSGRVLVEAQQRGRGDIHPLLQQLQVQTYIGIPLQAGGRIIGVLSLASPDVVRIDEPLLTRLTNIANYLAALVERRQVEEAMRHTQRLESLGVMAGGVAHDFNNLLSSILMHSSLALRKMEPEAAARHNLQQVIKTTRRAAELTHQLLAYTGKGHIEVQALDLNQLIQENVALLEMSIPRNVTLKADCTPDLPVVQGDAGQMQQLIMNLVINAAEAYGERSGMVWVRTLLGQVDHTPPPGREWQPGAYVCLVVEDQGVGMDEHTLDHIFDPFFTTKFTGRGLGLAAVSGIVQGHRGHISVSSTPGKGTSFCVFLPAQARQVQVDEPLPEEPVAPTERVARPGTILIVDDEVILRDGLTEYLALHGYRTLVADNGEAGLALVRKYGRQIDLIVLDMTMPVMSGRETLTAFQQLALDIPVFLISGYDETTIVEGIADTMVIDFLQKPFRAETFLARVEELLNRRRS